LNTAVPMTERLEWQFLPRDRFTEALKKLADY